MDGIERGVETDTVEGDIERNMDGVEGEVEDNGEREATYCSDDEVEQHGYIQDSDRQVEEAMQRLPSDVPIEDRPIDIKDNQSLALFMAHGCSCSKFGGKPCSMQFSVDYLHTLTLSC